METHHKPGKRKDDGSYRQTKTLNNVKKVRHLVLMDDKINKRKWARDKGDKGRQTRAKM